jgi:hypothetical protein
MMKKMMGLWVVEEPEGRRFSRPIKQGKQGVRRRLVRGSSWGWVCAGKARLFVASAIVHFIAPAVGAEGMVL